MNNSHHQKRLIIFRIVALFTFLLCILFIIFFLKETTGIFGNPYIRALKLISKEKYGASENILTKIIRDDPQYTKTYRKLGELFFLEDSLDRGTVLLDSLIREYPENYFLFYSKAYLYHLFRRNNKALEQYEKVLPKLPESAILYRDFVDMCKRLKRLDHADSVLNYLLQEDGDNAFIYHGLGYLSFHNLKSEKAIEFLDKSLSIRDDILEDYFLKGAICWSIGEYDEFLETSQIGLKKARREKELQYKCIFNGNIGLAYYYMGNYSSAIIFTKRAIRQARRAGEEQEEIRSIGNLGISYRDSQKYKKSINCTKKAIRLAIKIKDKNRETLFYRNIGSAYYMMGEYEQSLEYLNKSLSIAREIRDKYTECLTLYSLGLAKESLGDYTEALNYYNESLEIASGTSNNWAVGRCNSAIGLLYFEQGLYAQALDYNEKGLDIATSIGDTEGEANCLGNIATIYSNIGETNKTLEYYKKALEVSEKIENRLGVGINLENIGCTYHLLGEFEMALKYYKKALKVFKETVDKKELTILYGNIGSLMIDLKNYQKAEEYLNQALETAKDLNSAYSKAQLFLDFGLLKYNQKDYKTAISYFNDALKLINTINAPQLYWQAQAGLALVLKNQNKPELALEHYKAAIDKIGYTQHLLPVEDFQSGFMDEHMNVFEGVIELLAEMHNNDPLKGYDKLAFEFAEKAKARAFLQNLLESRANIKSGVSSELKLKENKILKRISNYQKQLFKGEITNHKRRELLSALENAEEEFKKLEREIKSENAKYANLYAPEPYSIEKIQKDILKRNEVILEYILGKEHSFFWVLSKGHFSFFELPDEENINKAVKEYLHTIEQPVSVSNPFLQHVIKSKEVFNLILKPCIKELNKGDHLIIVADDILNFLPFESLVINNSGNEEEPGYLIEDYVVSYSPSSTSLAFFQNPSSGRNQNNSDFLAFADPVFSGASEKSEMRSVSMWFRKAELSEEQKQDEGIFDRNKSTGLQVNTLPYSRTEVQQISKLFPPGHSKLYFGSAANEQNVKTESLDQYKYLHFATHGLIEEDKPFRSGILLSTGEGSEDGILQVNEILNLKLNADMVVLSACQTARGKLFHGEGIVGLSRSFFYSGASSVLVSLWNINDRSTAKLMTQFYTNLIQNNNKAYSLQQAKLSMIKSSNAYRHPYYWAPYILIGNSD